MQKVMQANCAVFRDGPVLDEGVQNLAGKRVGCLVTQGYGGQFLKVPTTAAERENRRVAIRRITALVAPVASAN